MIKVQKTSSQVIGTLLTKSRLSIRMLILLYSLITTSMFATSSNFILVALDSSTRSRSVIETSPTGEALFFGILSFFLGFGAQPILESIVLSYWSIIFYQADISDKLIYPIIFILKWEILCAIALPPPPSFPSKL